MITRAREVVGEVDEERGIGARVPVDHLVVVADTEHVVRGRRDQAHEQEVRGAEVLELVDQQVPALALQRTPHLGLPHQRLHRRRDLPVEVERVVSHQTVAELVEHLGEALDVAALHLDQLRRPQSELHLLQGFEIRPQRVGVRAEFQRDVRFDAVADFALVDHAHVRAGPANDVVAEGVERADLALGVARQVAQPLLHLGPGPPVVGERAHARGAVAALHHEMTEARREHRRLARTGRRQDPGRAARVQHRGALVGSQPTRGRAVGRGRIRTE